MMKVCPVCKSNVFDDMDTCYGCLHRFGKPDVGWPVAAKEAMPSGEASATGKAVPSGEVGAMGRATPSGEVGATAPPSPVAEEPSLEDALEEAKVVAPDDPAAPSWTVRIEISGPATCSIGEGGQAMPMAGSSLSGR